MSTGRDRHAAVALGNGRGLVTGGYGTSSAHATAELFTPGSRGVTYCLETNTSQSDELHVLQVIDARVE